MEAKLRKLGDLTRELERQVKELAAANRRLQAAYHNLEAALKIADEWRAGQRRMLARVSH